jgi:hypothetical protein
MENLESEAEKRYMEAIEQYKELRKICGLPDSIGSRKGLAAGNSLFSSG